jgi:hypothetical protein
MLWITASGIRCKCKFNNFTDIRIEITTESKSKFEDYVIVLSDTAHPRVVFEYKGEYYFYCAKHHKQSKKFFNETVYFLKSEEAKEKWHPKTGSEFLRFMKEEMEDELE